MSKLTDKQLKFCEEYVANGYKGGEAYGIAFENDNKNASRVGAYTLLRDFKIVEKIKEIEGNYKILGMEMGIDRKGILTKIKEMLNATKKTYHQGVLLEEVLDSNAVNNAIVTWAKLTGEFEAEKKQITLESEGLDKDPSKMTDEEREQVKTEILKEL
jgi:hypothetical protein